MDNEFDKVLARKHVLEYTKKLQELKMDIVSVYLFGSLVKGNFGEWSDIDIAVVSNNLTGDPVDDRLKLMKLRWDIDLRIEPHPFLPEDWEDETNPFVEEIKKTGEKII
ncbi:MAG: nucleotidyltransferase domain-containing protein [Candidatus Cloacimonadota bacterium]|nr:nucleotidyltransferase domain-containing protein [Candidatus Cloacimonadota bacterium]